MPYDRTHHLTLGSDAAPRAPDSKRLIPSDFLLPYDKPVRQPLCSWAKGVVRYLARLQQDRPTDLGGVAVCMNLAALIEAFLGSVERARQLCNGQLLWLSHLLERCPQRELYEIAFQPWVNLGRLCCFQGAYEDARTYFAFIRAYDAGLNITMGPCLIDSHALHRIKQENPSFRQFVESVSMIETIKCFIAERAYEPALQFIDSHRHTYSATFQDYLVEAEIISLSGLSKYDEAHVKADRVIQRLAPSSQMIFELHKVYLLALMGQEHKARILARKLVAVLTLWNLLENPNPNILRYAKHLAGLSEHLGDTTVAAELCRSAFKAAIAVKDQPYQLSFAKSLIKLSSGPEQEDWIRRRTEILDNSLYASVLTSEGISVDQRRCLHPVFDQLFDTINGVVGGNLTTPAGGIERSGLNGR